MPTIDEIANNEGVTFERIGNLLRASAEKQFGHNALAETMWYRLKRFFPEIKLIKSNFTFIRPFDQKEMSISGLLLKPFFTASQHVELKFLETREAVNLLLNWKKQIDEKTSDVYIQSIYDLIKLDISKREKHAIETHEKFCKAASKIVGTYKMDNGHDIIISNRAIDIFMKSTGQKWERESCERVGGEYDVGIYSDIEWCNLIAFLYSADEDMPIARVMLRTCETGDHEPSFGIETVFYTSDGRMPVADGGDIDGVDLKDIVAKLHSIIKKKGFNVEYDTCTTPYQYKGYSDKAHQGGGMMINYGNPPFNAMDVFRGELEVASECPYCYTRNQWEFELSVETDSFTTETIEKSVNKLDGQIIKSYHVHDVSVEYIDENVFRISSGVVPCNCIKCGARIIIFDFTSVKQHYQEISKATLEKRKMSRYQDNRAFEYFSLATKIKILTARSKNIQEYIMQIFGAYSRFIKKLATKEQQVEFARFVMNSSVTKKTRAKEHPKKYSRKFFIIEDRYNAGENNAGEGEYCIYFNPKNTDLESIVRDYASSRFKDEPMELMTGKVMSAAQLKKFKKLDKFCKQ